MSGETNYSIQRGTYRATFGIRGDNSLINLRGFESAQEMNVDSSGISNTKIGDKGYGIYFGPYNPIVYVKSGKIIGVKEPQEDLKINVIKGNSSTELEIDKKGIVKED